MNVNQQTLAQSFSFEGKGLHTGTYAHMTVLPAPAGSGIVFRRVDVEGCPEVKGMGVDNAVVELDNQEVPILDGSARFYVEAIAKVGLEDQGVPRQFISIPYALEVKDPRSGSWIKIEPADAPSAQSTVDFNSPVLGVQNAKWDLSTDYAKEIAPCRTFCFYKEIEPMLKGGLIKGGDLDNALVVTDEGYMGNPVLHFTDECGRHKLLDLLGDMRLCGGYLNARITGFKAGHTINTKAAKALRALLK